MSHHLRSNKEFRNICNQIENHCENLFKTFSLESEKASLENHLNPKKLDMEFTNWRVDIENDLKKLRTIDNFAFDHLKGNIHSFEKSAEHLIDAYKAKPEKEDGSTKFDYLKILRDSKDELQILLKQIFQTIKTFIS